MCFSNEKQLFYLLILLLTILCGLFNTIYYFEDIDSLRFATAIKYGYDISKMQPHFPGYPIFHFFASIIYLVTNNLGLTFSLIGSISLFIMIISTIKIINSESLLNNLFITLAILFNPLFSLMSTRYMPDLFGLAICTIIFYFLMYSNNSNRKIFGFFLCGILIGIRLSYFPLIIVLMIYVFLNSKNLIYLGTAFLLGILVWLLPLILHQGWVSIYDAGASHMSGHFTQYGGTIFTEKNIFIRFKSIFHTLWADGFGGYWANRSILTILISFYLFFFIKKSIFHLNEIKNQKIKIIIICIAVYFVWIFLFQNVIYKSRHILPLIMMLMLLIFQLVSIKNYKNQYLVLIALWIVLTINLNIDHKNETSVSKLKTELNYKNLDYIISYDLINYYMRRNGIKPKKGFINYPSLSDSFFQNSNKYKVVLIGDYNFNIDTLYKYNFKDTIFFHNPYMNRMWSSIPVFYSE